MGGQHPLKSALRRTAPLAAVLMLAGPGAAEAAAPSPDAPPGAAALAPDPVPAPASRPRAVSRHVTPAAPATPRFVEVARTPAPPTTAVASRPRASAPRPHPHVRRPKPAAAEPISDVVPIPADPHPSADNSGIIDWTLVALAAGALLVAAVVAGSGARLASVIEERP